MTLDYITSLTNSGESEALEFKETTGTRREAAVTVCALLKQCGGQVLFGVTQAGEVAGQQVTEAAVAEGFIQGAAAQTDYRGDSGGGTYSVSAWC